MTPEDWVREKKKKRGARFVTGPAEAITKEEHDLRTEGMNRPLTQDPIGWHKRPGSTIEVEK